MGERNLNIQDYSLQEVLDLYGLSKAHITEEEMLQAKKKTLMMHPDKSRLPPEYFNFYRSAYDIVLKYYREKQKTNLSLPTENPDYVAEEVHPTNFVAPKPTAQFQEKFNQLFEKEAINKERVEKQRELFGWFSSADHDSATKQPVVKNVKDLDGALNTLRKQQPHSLMVYQKEARPLTTGSFGGNYYEDVEDVTETEYIASDTFSRLKYDDIRRVHKDQTILPELQSDPTRPVTLDNYTQQRDDPRNLVPIDKSSAEKVMEKHRGETMDRWTQRYEKSQQRVFQNEVKNKHVLSSFLQLRE